MTFFQISFGKWKVNLSHHSFILLALEPLSSSHQQAWSKCSWLYLFSWAKGSWSIQNKVLVINPLSSIKTLQESFMEAESGLRQCIFCYLSWGEKNSILIFIWSSVKWCKNLFNLWAVLLPGRRRMSVCGPHSGSFSKLAPNSKERHVYTVKIDKVVKLWRKPKFMRRVKFDPKTSNLLYSAKNRSIFVGGCQYWLFNQYLHLKGYLYWQK